MKQGRSVSSAESDGGENNTRLDALDQEEKAEERMDLMKETGRPAHSPAS